MSGERGGSPEDITNDACCCCCCCCFCYSAITL